MKNKLIFLLCISVIAILLKLLSLSKFLVENFYSKFIYKKLAGGLNKLSGKLSFSLGEILIIIFVIIVILFIIFTIKNLIIEKERLKILFTFLYAIICAAIIVYIIFMSIWGLNYYRMPIIDNYSKYMEKQIDNEDIYSLAEYLIKDINNLKSQIKYSEINTNYQALNRMVEVDYKNIFEEFNFLNMNYSRTKPIKSSKLFLYLQISGIYNPFTFESNVNILIPYVSFPFTIAHEISHQIGISYEDEANFLAYLVCSKSEDLFIRYSGDFEILLYILGELNRDEDYGYLISNLNEETKKEIKEYNEFWKQYSGDLSKISEKVNDTYLKANSQKEGVKSYSRVVRLLVYYYRSKNII